MNKEDKILILGASGLVGSNLVNELKKQEYDNLLLPHHIYIDLLDYEKVYYYFNEYNPDFVFMCAAKVGGIMANDKYSADFIWENTIMQSNVIKCAHDFKVKKLLFLGSSCVYAGGFNMPIKEDYFLIGKMQSENLGYSMAKINGIIMCQMFNKQYGDNFISVMPSNIFGKGDKYDLENGHVLASLIKKIHDAKINNAESITLWGDGFPRREFLFAEDLADALIFLMNNYDSSEIINIGTGEDITIFDLANLISEVIGYNGTVIFDKSKPNGTMRKVLDVTKINKLGWKAKTSLKEGIEKTYEYYLRRNYDTTYCQ